MSDTKAVRDYLKELRNRADTKLRQSEKLTGEDIKKLPPEEILRMLHELQVHQIELQMQNEELQDAQIELARAKEKYFDLYDLAPAAYLTVNQAGIIMEGNLTAVQLLGISRALLKTKPLSAFIYREDQDIYFIHRKQLMGEGISQRYSLRLENQAGGLIWVTIQAAGLKNETGETNYRYIISDIREIKSAEDTIRNLLAEKEVILIEVHHRLKNNMSMLMSMLSLQSNTLTDPGAVEALNDTISRIQSMMILYDKLYQSEDTSSISAAVYLPALIDEIIANFPQKPAVRCVREIEDFAITAKKAQILGIIINELMTNCMKYAFRGQMECSILIYAKHSGETALFTIEDNGVSLPENITLENSTGFGLTLVRILIQQLMGSIRIERDNGTRFIIEMDL